VLESYCAGVLVAGLLIYSFAKVLVCWYAGLLTNLLVCKLVKKEQYFWAAGVLLFTDVLVCWFANL